MAPRAPFLYTTPESVKVRLGSKVQFQAGSTPLQEELSNELFFQLVRDAEADVELALCARYFVPLQGAGGGPFGTLPDHTIRQIRKAVDLRAQALIIDQDFGRSGHTDASAFSKQIAEQYEAAIEALLGKQKIGQTSEKDRPFMTPPLPGLRLALTNRSDKGTFGKVVNTDASDRDASSYANQQQNDPSRTYIPRGRSGQIP